MASPWGQRVGSTILSNNEVMSILMDYTNFPGTAVATVNTNHQSNPQQTKFLNAMMSGWTWNPGQAGPALGGVGNDLVYRDPWGNPYVISMDLNYDDQCQDWFYGKVAVSKDPAASNPLLGFYGLVSPGVDVRNRDNYQFHGKIMVWSAGADGKVDINNAANTGLNKDNVLSWW